MPSKKCLTRVSHKTVKQECLTRALRNSVKQGCPTRVLPQCVNSGCLTSEFAGDVTNKYCLCLSTYVSAFGFVGFILFHFSNLHVFFGHGKAYLGELLREEIGYRPVASSEVAWRTWRDVKDRWENGEAKGSVQFGKANRSKPSKTSKKPSETVENSCFC